jgi:hypothetical protein
MHHEETLLLVPRLLTLWCWSWTLTYFWKTLTWTILFEPNVLRLWYLRYRCIIKTPFFCTKTFDHVTLILNFDLVFNLDYIFWTFASFRGHTSRRAMLSSDNSCIELLYAKLSPIVCVQLEMNCSLPSCSCWFVWF